MRGFYYTSVLCLGSTICCIVLHIHKPDLLLSSTVACIQRDLRNPLCKQMECHIPWARISNVGAPSEETTIQIRWLWTWIEGLLVRVSYVGYWSSWAGCSKDIVDRYPAPANDILTTLAALQSLDNEEYHAGAECLVSVDLDGKQRNREVLLVMGRPCCRPASTRTDNGWNGIWRVAAWLAV